MNYKLKLAIETLVGILIIAFLLSKLNISEIVSILSHTSYLLLSLAILIYIVSFVITAYGLKVLFDSIEHIRFKIWLKYYLSTFSLGLVLPGQAGPFSLIYFLKRDKFSIGSTTALVIIDKLTTLLVFGIISILGLLLFIPTKEIYFGILMMCVILLLGIFLFSEIGRMTIKRILGKYSVKFTNFYGAFKNLMVHNKSKFIINLIVTLLRPFLNGLLIVVIFKSLGYDVSLLYAIVISSITLIVSLIPLTPNGLGIREGTGLLLFNKLSIPFEATLAMYLIIIFMSYSSGIVGLIYYFCNKQDENKFLKSV